jgi:hypothetical protein
MIRSALFERLAARPSVRRAADAYFHAYSRRRVRRLDALAIAETQEATLLKLVRRAQGTRFGRDHCFATIGNIRDYQRQVLLRDYDVLWKDYWQPAFPRLRNITWPETIQYFALSSGTTTGTTKYLPVSRQLVASNKRAGLTSLAWFMAARPHARLFGGKLFLLGGSTDLTPPDPSCPGILGGDLSGILAREVPAVLRPFQFPPLDIALLRDWERKLDLLAERSAALPITFVSGIPSWLLVLFERLQQVTGKSCIADIWPTLQVVVHGGTSFEPYRSLFHQVIGNDDVQFLETYASSEGFLASEDPRYRLMRLIPDHDIFYEFVPVDELGRDKPTRHTVADIVPGVQYAVVLTTCAGLWSYLIGDTVCFERRDPPLLRFTGRTRQFLSAFGEHLIGEEVERAIAQAATATGAAVTDFHVGPLFPESPRDPGRHRYLVEFATPPLDLGGFVSELDTALCRSNEDYQAHRVGDLTMLEPEVVPVRRGGFADWLRSRGQLGGQHKLPRLDNSGRLTQDLAAWLGSHGLLADCAEIAEAQLK